MCVCVTLSGNINLSSQLRLQNSVQCRFSLDHRFGSVHYFVCFVPSVTYERRIMPCAIVVCLMGVVVLHPPHPSDIVDIKPANMEELTEVITSAEFHPQQCNLFVYSSSKGTLRLCDMREAALCDKHSKCEFRVHGHAHGHTHTHAPTHTHTDPLLLFQCLRSRRTPVIVPSSQRSSPRSLTSSSATADATC